MSNPLQWAVWFDDTPKKPLARKIAEGYEAMVAHHGKPDGITMCQEEYDAGASAARLAYPGLTFEPSATVKKDTLWFVYKNGVKNA